MRNLFCFIFFILCSFTLVERVESFNTNNTLESINRRIYAFNRGFDKSFINPIIKIYIRCPSILDYFMKNFFNNSAKIQNLLFYFLLHDSISKDDYLNTIFFNSYFGLFGIIDMSSHIGLYCDVVDFQKFLFKKKYYKVDYMMLPLIGPGTMYINIGLVFSYLLNPFFYFFDNFVCYYFLEILSKKSFIFFDGSFFHDKMVDGYLFLRDIYIQHLENIYEFDCDLNFNN